MEPNPDTFCFLQYPSSAPVETVYVPPSEPPPPPSAARPLLEVAVDEAERLEEYDKLKVGVRLGSGFGYVLLKLCRAKEHGGLHLHTLWLLRVGKK